MRIALVYPATRIDKKVLPECLPMGILYLAAIAERDAGATVDVYDARHGSIFPPMKRINDYDVIGFSAMTLQVTTALKLANRARKAGFSGKLVFGGPHASVAPEHLMNQSCVDAVFIGEAEHNFIQYLNYIAGKEHHVERTWIREVNGTWKYYDEGAFIEDLDSLPFPAREKYGDLPARLRSINMSTSRGCPFDCNYCQPSKRILFGKKVRRRSTQNIMAEIEDALQRFHITRFAIDDDIFPFLKSAVLEFCEAVKPLGLTWSCQSRSDIDRATLTAMRDAGCNLIIVGAESGSQRMLDLMNKKNTVEQNAAFMRTCNELGINTWCNMMVGYPGETEEDMKRSLEFVRETQPTLTNVSQVTPFPGTSLWDNHKEDIINADWTRIARYIHRPRFKSLARNQILIKNYITLMNKRWKQPVSADLVNLSAFTWRLCCSVPFLLRVLVHREHRKQAALERALEKARSGEMDRAISKLKKLTRFRSTRASALGHLAWLYLSTGRPADANKCYERLIKIQPENVEARHLLAKSLLRTGKKDQARAQVQEALRMNPNYAPFPEILSELDKSHQPPAKADNH
jgi:anaerobic magnesium-protoporphyrin IX monomethyl ester cyclase